MEHVASIGNVMHVRPDVVATSNQSDLCVWSACEEQFLEPNGSIFEGWL
jgi:hypothetical protein